MPKTIKAKVRQMSGKVKLEFKEKKEAPVFVSPEIASKLEVGDEYVTESPKSDKAESKEGEPEGEKKN